MFATWELIYRRVREQKLASGAAVRAPVNSAKLHQVNVIPSLVKEHAAARSIEAVAAG